MNVPENEENVGERGDRGRDMAGKARAAPTGPLWSIWQVKDGSIFLPWDPQDTGWQRGLAQQPLPRQHPP